MGGRGAAGRVQRADLLSHRGVVQTALRHTAIIREFKRLGEGLRVAGPCPTVRMGPPNPGPFRVSSLHLSCSPRVPSPSLWVLLSHSPLTSLQSLSSGGHPFCTDPPFPTPCRGPCSPTSQGHEDHRMRAWGRQVPRTLVPPAPLPAPLCSSAAVAPLSEGPSATSAPSPSAPSSARSLVGSPHPSSPSLGLPVLSAATPHVCVWGRGGPLLLVSLCAFSSFSLPVASLSSPPSFCFSASVSHFPTLISP